MSVQQHNPKILDAAWEEIKLEFTSAGLAEPAPGFTYRFKQRLLARRQEEQRRQAWIFVGINTIAAILLLSLIGLMYIPALSRPGSLLLEFVGMFSRVVVFIKMVLGLGGSLIRTLPGVVPFSWWMGATAGLIVLCMLWLSMFHQAAQEQGVS
jgi:hypothetical protein